MERRRFLKNTSLGVASFALAACRDNSSSRKIKGDRFSTSSYNFGKLEKTDLSIGFIPLTDCAPLVIAKEKGFFSRYGLNVTLYKQPDWQAIKQGFLEGRFDAAQALFAMPLFAQLEAKTSPMISLMVLNLNGSAITLDQKAWNADIRPSIEYSNFQEFKRIFRKYIRGTEEKLTFATDSPISMDSFNYLYWLAVMGIDPEKEIKLITLPPSQMIYKLQAGEVNGYCIGEPWNQQAIIKKAGFTAYINRDIWQGYPGKVLATMQPWVDKYPTTARALVASVLEACQFCDQSENRQEIAQILAQEKYLDTNLLAIEPSLIGSYNYGSFDQKNRTEAIEDFNLFHFQETDYLKEPNHVNYPWRSHGVWLLTQMIRWNQIKQREYPKDADKLLEQVYPLEIYKDVAKALKIKLPSEPMKIEPAKVFIDQRKFDPSDPVNYLNKFKLRANRSKLFK